MNRMISRSMRLAFGAAVLASAGFGVRTAVAAPASPAETSLACRPGTLPCTCDDYTWCQRAPCPICA